MTSNLLFQPNPFDHATACKGPNEIFPKTAQLLAMRINEVGKSVDDGASLVVQEFLRVPVHLFPRIVVRLHFRCRYELVEFFVLPLRLIVLC